MCFWIRTHVMDATENRLVHLPTWYENYLPDMRTWRRELDIPDMKKKQDSKIVNCSLFILTHHTAHSIFRFNYRLSNGYACILPKLEVLNFNRHSCAPKICSMPDINTKLTVNERKNLTSSSLKCTITKETDCSKLASHCPLFYCD